eukprot:CAMPEP_0113691700 /NCGR_PEP_ID=MMETSP0038_2-20120614/18617_1 /TAXON_ID=2898 /ORGANISM="Cryptomonas paramecium" /LENGTH=301 /DNA_ID=CAMNT_0000613415 /DNA_START=96 /DNA_END=998 /DNA_ORIENTATION=+ /assembly_acc=CAM_ASM_000170
MSLQGASLALALVVCAGCMYDVVGDAPSKSEDTLVADIDPNALVTRSALNAAGARETEKTVQHDHGGGRPQKRQYDNRTSWGGSKKPEGPPNQHNSSSGEGSMPYHPPRNASTGNSPGPSNNNRTVPVPSGNPGATPASPPPANDPAYMLQIRARVTYSAAQLQDEGLHRSLRQAVALSASVDVSRVTLIVQGSARRDALRQATATIVNFTIGIPDEMKLAAAAAAVTMSSVNARLAALQLQPVTSLESSTSAFVRTPLDGLPPPIRFNQSRNVTNVERPAPGGAGGQPSIQPFPAAGGAA